MNTIAFFEIHADDIVRAKDFYTNVFGWEFEEQKDFPIEYWQIKTETINGGLLKRPLLAGGQGTNAFICSIMVEDFNATAAKIEQNGGRVALPKFAVPGKCWQGYFLDAESNTFGIFQVDEAAR